MNPSAGGAMMKANGNSSAASSYATHASLLRFIRPLALLTRFEWAVSVITISAACTTLFAGAARADKPLFEARQP